MNNSSTDGPTFPIPRGVMRRTQRSDSIPEHSEATTGASNAADVSIQELLMRHSSPLYNRSTGEAIASPMAERNSSPSPLRLNRPRSNPRSRTPMRIPEGDDEQGDIGSSTREGRRITFRLGSGSAIGVNTASYAARRVSVHITVYRSIFLCVE